VVKRTGAPLPATPQEWRAYLTEYSDAFLSGATEDGLWAVEDDQISARWLGYQPASDQTLAETEERLGIPLPPSLRGFLLTSDGWGPVAGWVHHLYACSEIDWFRETDTGQMFLDLESGRPAEPDDAFQDFLDVVRHGLIIAEGEDVWLLDTRTAAAGGEYAAYQFAVKYGEMSEPYPSFAALVASGRQEIEGLHDGAKEDDRRR
jgi:SMI1 / KNR4 family (SUKH-1)